MQKINFEKGFATVIVVIVAVIAVVGISVIVWLNFKPEVSQPSPTPTPDGPRRINDNSSTMIPLGAQNNSNLSAKYQLTAVGSPSGISSQTRVSIAVSNAPQGVPMPAHIHSGSCAKLGAVKYPLFNVVNGSSTTTIDQSILQVKLELPLAINIHKSVAESGVYVACADLNSDRSLDILYNSPAK